MLPFENILQIDRNSKFPIYLKIANAIIDAISKGTLVAGTRLPSTRDLAKILKVHRKTVVAAYDELTAQSWIISKNRKGTFVNENLPVIKATPLKKSKSIVRNEVLDIHQQYKYILDGGSPDTRLTVLKELGRVYASLLRNEIFLKKLAYRYDFMGDKNLRKELVSFLKNTRGIHIHTDNILTTRGSVMAFYLICAHLISKNDKVIVGYPGYYAAFETAVIRNQGKVLKVPVDKNGLDIDHLEQLCKKHQIKLVMIIPHHHYPTTVTLSAVRRIQLLDLARKYGFLIFEDDWDYDFHYRNSPILPLASIDNLDRVIYAGSFSKIISPALRLGYVVANPEILAAITAHRRIIDRTGDIILERAISELLRFGDIDRNIRKVKKIYEKRRNLMYHLLKKNFDNLFNITLPEGGMGIWLPYKNKSLGKHILQNAEKQSVFIRSKLLEEGLIVGYASTNEKEIKKRIAVLRKLVN